MTPQYAAEQRGARPPGGAAQAPFRERPAKVSVEVSVGPGFRPVRGRITRQGGGFVVRGCG